MITLIVQIVVAVLLVIGYIVFIVKDQKNKKNASEQSALYNELLVAFKIRNNPFAKEGHSDYVDIIDKQDNAMIEHTIAIVEGNLQTESVNTIVLAAAQTLFSLCSFFLGKQLGEVNGIDVEMITTTINILAVGAFLWLIAPAYISVKRQKYFLEIMKFELEKKKEEQKLSQSNEELILRVKMLKEEVEDLKKKRTKGIHITFDS